MTIVFLNDRFEGIEQWHHVILSWNTLFKSKAYQFMCFVGTSPVHIQCLNTDQNNNLYNMPLNNNY